MVAMPIKNKPGLGDASHEAQRECPGIHFGPAIFKKFDYPGLTKVIRQVVGFLPSQDLTSPQAASP